MIKSVLVWVALLPLFVLAQQNNADSVKLSVADSLKQKHIQDSVMKIALADSLSLNKLADSVSKLPFSISYDIIINAEKQNSIAEAYNGAVKTIYVKDRRAKLKFVSLIRSQTIFFWYKSPYRQKVATVVKESGKEKYKFYLNEQIWKRFHRSHDSLNYILTSDSLYVLGYKCRKATLPLKEEASLVVYYAPGVKSQVLSAAEPLFGNLPGIPMLYEFRKGKNEITYAATEISFLAIPEAYFKEPTNGYKIRKFKPGAGKAEKLLLDDSEDDDDEGEEK